MPANSPGAWRRWASFFVDGDHEGAAAVRDAEACAGHGEDDALILFHDLAAAALEQLRELG